MEKLRFFSNFWARIGHPKNVLLVKFGPSSTPNLKKGQKL